MFKWLSISFEWHQCMKHSNVWYLKLLKIDVVLVTTSMGVSVCEGLEMGKREIEYKLHAGRHSALKFFSLEEHENAINKIKYICKLIGIKYVGEPEKLRLTDRYFDDVDEGLRSQKITVRIREKKNQIRQSQKYIVSIKKDISRDEDVAIIRLEAEQSVRDADSAMQILTKNGKLKKLAASSDITIDQMSYDYKNNMTIMNKRLSVPISTELSNYRICFDRFYYYFPSSGKYAPYCSEIEIESLSEFYENDEKIESLVQSIEEILGFETHKIGKVERGYHWLKNTSLISAFVVFFDIIGYSKKNNMEQERTISNFSYFVRKALKDKAREMIGKINYIPTGDGMALIFPFNQQLIVPFVIELQRLIKKRNQTLNEESRYEFRTGISTGPLIEYSDINRNINVAGDGINMAQRVMDIGAAWHILATEEAYQSIALPFGDRGIWNHVGRRKVKHDRYLTIYNIYDNLDGFGNPIAPAGSSRR